MSKTDRSHVLGVATEGARAMMIDLANALEKAIQVMEQDTRRFAVMDDLRAVLNRGRDEIAAAARAAERAETDAIGIFVAQFLDQHDNVIYSDWSESLGTRPLSWPEATAELATFGDAVNAPMDQVKKVRVLVNGPVLPITFPYTVSGDDE